MAKKKPAKDTASDDAGSPVQSIDELRKRYESLNRRKIESERDLKNAQERLQQLQDDAVRQFETHDVEELRAKLARMEADNEKRRADYQSLLENITADLTKIESGDSEVQTEDEKTES